MPNVLSDYKKILSNDPCGTCHLYKLCKYTEAHCKAFREWVSRFQTWNKDDRGMKMSITWCSLSGIDDSECQFRDISCEKSTGGKSCRRELVFSDKKI